MNSASERVHRGRGTCLKTRPRRIELTEIDRQGFVGVVLGQSVHCSGEEGLERLFWGCRRARGLGLALGASWRVHAHVAAYMLSICVYAAYMLSICCVYAAYMRLYRGCPGPERVSDAC